MDQSRLNKQKTLDTKKAIKTLAIIALIFVAIRCIGYFVQYNYVENNEDYSITHQLSIELDELIAQYYRKSKVASK